MRDPTQRFSSRVENYVKFRPGYPPEIIDFLRTECGLVPTQTIADIGSGTGKLSELFVQNRIRVIGIEPNKDMRDAGDRLLKEFSHFKSLAATAEATTLDDHSIDMITAGQAFHWFDRDKTRAEFVRILKPGGWVVLIWNDRQTDTTPFLKAYEQLLHEFSIDYREVNHKNVDAATIGAFFAPDSFKKESFPNAQVVDFDGLKGRLLSSSYAPEAGHPRFEPMLKSLEAIFTKYAVHGTVSLDYDTLVFHGQLT